MRYDAKAIGSGSEGAQTELQDSWHKVGDASHTLTHTYLQVSFLSQNLWMLRVLFAVFQSLTLQEAKVLTLKVLKQVMEEKLDENNVQLALVTPKQRFMILGKEELKEVIDKVESTPASDSTNSEGQTAQEGQSQTATVATSSTAEI